ncbi:Acg family FMN-binding oxidoreductase [Luedemannella helvata]|uniref:NAD(P)H nitroreductase n=1 Tax=Luedemannella helvata TaxID=349315 RepID=A0ABP4WTH2_9ACTN
MADRSPYAAEVAVLLRGAVAAALRAPSVLNTQPWRWRLSGSTLELYRDPSRQLHVLDPDGRLAVLSCGAALHHARVSLAAARRRALAERFPDPAAMDLLARLTVAPGTYTDQREIAMAHAIQQRRTDRRLIAHARYLGEEQLAPLSAAATGEGVTLHRVTPGQRHLAAVAADRAQRIQDANGAYAREIANWTRHRSAGSGVDAASMVAPVQRPVPLRDLSGGGETGLHSGFGDDDYAEYLILATRDDTALDWLRAGEAASAVWLTATVGGLAMSAISEVIEVPEARVVLSGLLDQPHFPQLVLRTGLQGHPSPAPASSRRALRDVLEELPPCADDPGDRRRGCGP